MRLCALTELHDPEAIELFITEEDAKRALEDCLRDEPQWSGCLEVTRSSSITNTLRSTSYVGTEASGSVKVILLAALGAAGNSVTSV